ncbi:MAG: hypothetical protein RR063_09390 [Anaerovoracaceae bacterium]
MLREKIPNRSYCGEKFHTNPTNKKYLAKDFEHRCAYCNDPDAYGGGYRAYHVEHFAPKEKFPALRFCYENLLYSCPWCNRAKWDIWPSDDPAINIIGDKGFIDPCAEEYDNHLNRLSDGSIVGITPLGKYMHGTLHLYLKRHAVVHNMDRLKQKMDELEDSIAADKLVGKDCNKKEAALKLITKDFFEYFDMWKEVSEETT